MSLSGSELGRDPIVALKRWVEYGRDAGLGDDLVVTLATASSVGDPDARLVVVRSIDEDGVTFYNDSRSPKGRQLAENPRAAMVAYWGPLGRQVRIRGRVRTLPPSTSDEAFRSRERRSQIGYWAHEQSAPIGGRVALEKNFDDVARGFEGTTIPRPSHWLSYSLEPGFIEFWQKGDRHLHDRIAYTWIGESWSVERLQP